MSVSSDAQLRPNSTPVFTHHDTLSEVERHVLAALRNIRFGTLEIVVHDSRIVQIERAEKTRFDVRGKPLSESIS